MQGPIRLVLFDLGSTLIFERGPWDGLFAQADDALWRVLRQYGVTLQPRVVYGDAQTFLDFYSGHYRSDLNEPTTAAILGGLLRRSGFPLSEEQLREAMRAMYFVTQSNWSAEEDAVSTLGALKERGFRLGLISNAADDDNTQTLIDKGGLRPYLEYIVSSAAFGRRKPDPSIFQSALEFFGVSAQEAIMVGDNLEADIGGAHRSGMQGIWIKRRALPQAPDSPELRPDATVSALSEIPPLLENNTRRE